MSGENITREKIEITEVAQVLFKGDEFRRKPDPSINITQPRRVKVIGGYNNNGGIVFRPIEEVGQTYPSDLSILPLNEADKLHFHSDVNGQQLLTVRKHGSSTSEHSVDDEFRRRGGNPKYRPPKIGGFFFGEKTLRELDQLRRLNRLRPGR